MRNYFILFALCVFFAGISYYLANTLNPFNQTQITELIHSEKITASQEFDQVITDLINKGLIAEFLDVRNVSLLVTTVLLSVLYGFMFIHLLIDKLFFRKFYEQASILLAVRRGLFVCLMLISLFIYRIYAADWYLAALTIGLILIVELVIGRLVPTKRQIDEDEDVLEPGLTDPNIKTNDIKPAKRGFKLTVPHIRMWPGRFKEKVMQQVAESEADINANEIETVKTDDLDEDNVELDLLTGADDDIA